MKYFMYLALLMGLVWGSSYAATIEDKATGQTFPSEVSFDYGGKDYTLEATGVATRKKFMFKVYSVASYLQEGGNGQGDKIQQIMQPDSAKQLTLKWVRNVNAEKVQNGFRNSLEKVITDGGLRGEVDKFVSFFNEDVKVGDEQVLRWVPGGTIVVIINGTEKGTIENQEFAKALWNVWFGKKSVVKRDDLTSSM